MKYNAANEICAIGTSAPSECASPSEPGIVGEPTYDADGDMTSDGSSAPTKFSYTERDQLAGITPREGSSIQVVSHGTGQEDLAALASEEVVQNVLGVGVTGSGEAAHYYTRGSEGALLAKRTAKGTPSETSYYLDNVMGSVAMVTNSTGGQAAPASGRFQYDAFGAPVGTAASMFGYESAQTVPDGLVHFGARYYDPALGSWTQQDPAGLTESDRYQFASGDPVNVGDPNGEHAAGCWIRAFHRFACDYRPPTGCVVDLSGHLSSCREVLHKAEEEYEADEESREAIEEVTGLIICAVSDGGDCPEYGQPGH